MEVLTIGLRPWVDGRKGKSRRLRLVGILRCIVGKSESSGWCNVKGSGSSSGPGWDNVEESESKDISVLRKGQRVLKRCKLRKGRSRTIQGP